MRSGQWLALHQARRNESPRITQQMTRDQYGQVYQQGLNRTIRFLMSRGVEADTAPDIAQGAWVRGWERLEQLRDDRMLITWVNTIALNQYRRVIRSDRLRQALPAVDSGITNM